MVYAGKDFKEGLTSYCVRVHRTHSSRELPYSCKVRNSVGIFRLRAIEHRRQKVCRGAPLNIAPRSGVFPSMRPREPQMTGIRRSREFPAAGMAEHKSSGCFGSALLGKRNPKLVRGAPLNMTQGESSARDGQVQCDVGRSKNAFAVAFNRNIA
jgi:hypothetical protein